MIDEHPTILKAYLGHYVHRSQFQYKLIRLEFNPNYFSQNYTYFRQFFKEC